MLRWLLSPRIRLLDIIRAWRMSRFTDRRRSRSGHGIRRIHRVRSIHDLRAQRIFGTNSRWRICFCRFLAVEQFGLQRLRSAGGGCRSALSFSPMIALIAFGVIALVGFILALAHGVVMDERIYSKLRARHPDLWKHLGSPDRYFDDGGLMRRVALGRLLREPTLLRRCDAEIVSEIQMARRHGRVCLVLGLIALVGCLTFCLAQV